MLILYVTDKLRHGV